MARPYGGRATREANSRFLNFEIVGHHPRGNAGDYRPAFSLCRLCRRCSKAHHRAHRPPVVRSQLAESCSKEIAEFHPPLRRVLTFGG